MTSPFSEKKNIIAMIPRVRDPRGSGITNAQPKLVYHLDLYKSNAPLETYTGWFKANIVWMVW